MIIIPYGIRNKGIILAGVATVICSLIYLEAKDAWPFNYLECQLDNLRVLIGSKAPVCPRLVFCAIDNPQPNGSILDKTDDKIFHLMSKPFPWSREIWALTLDKLGNAQAKVICFDVLFDLKREGDEFLKKTLRQYEDRIVLACAFKVTLSAHGEATTLFLPNQSVYEGDPLPTLPFETGTIGHANIICDQNKMPQRFESRINYEMYFSDPPNAKLENINIDSFSICAVRKYLQTESFKALPPIPRFKYAGQHYPVVPVTELFEVDPIV